MSKSRAPYLADFREYNREQLLDWLAANAGGGLMPEGMGVRRIDKRHKPGAGFPLGGEMLAPWKIRTPSSRTRSCDGSSTTWKVASVVARDTHPAYFAASASPARAEERRWQASDGASEHYAVLHGRYLAAVEWMLGRAEEVLEREGRMRLVAPSPYPEDLETIQPKRLRSEARHRRVRDLFYRLLEELGDEREA
ncbi:MAG: hypothetical protein M3R38_20710 [Actinomycetota bacterium]|nr:hypothetical protein [Actinomycetota bacterium]